MPKGVEVVLPIVVIPKDMTVQSYLAVTNKSVVGQHSKVKVELLKAVCLTYNWKHS